MCYYVFMHKDKHASACMCLHVSTYIYVPEHKCMSVHEFFSCVLCLCTHASVLCKYICICKYMHILAYNFMCVDICLYVYMCYEYMHVRIV